MGKLMKRNLSLIKFMKVKPKINKFSFRWLKKNSLCYKKESICRLWHMGQQIVVKLLLFLAKNKTKSSVNLQSMVFLIWPSEKCSKCFKQTTMWHFLLFKFTTKMSMICWILKESQILWTSCKTRREARMSSAWAGFRSFHLISCKP